MSDRTQKLLLALALASLIGFMLGRKSMADDIRDAAQGFWKNVIDQASEFIRRPFKRDHPKKGDLP